MNSFTKLSVMLSLLTFSLSLALVPFPSSGTAELGLKMEINKSSIVIGEYYPPKPGTYQPYGIAIPVGLMCGPINVTVKSAYNLRLRTDKHVYLLGENVTIILENISNSTVYIGGYPAWQILTYPEEKPVFPKVYYLLAWNLEPGQSDVFIWNQYDEFNDRFVKPGVYIVKDMQGWNIYTIFVIVANPLAHGGDLEWFLYVIIAVVIVAIAIIIYVKRRPIHLV